jgi:periplasmic divalent cation tolerance protein
MNIVILITCSNKGEANKIAEALIKEKKAACVNIVPIVESVFWWEGKVDRSKESLLIVKTKKASFPQVEKLVKSLHSYSVPEIIALEVTKGEKKYLEWINESVR